LVAAAKAESGPLKVQLKMDPSVYNPIVEEWNKLYPDIKVEVQQFEKGGDDKFVLELQSNQVNTDLMYCIAQAATYFDIAPYTDDGVNILKLAKDGVVDIPQEAIDPKHPSLLAITSGLSGTAFNPKMVKKEDVPNWEGFTDPKWKGKFMTNLDGVNISLLRISKGDDWVDKYFKDLLANDPIFVDSDTSGLARLVAGEFPLGLGVNYYSALRLKQKDPSSIDVIVPDPVANHVTNLLGVYKKSKNRAQAVLFDEFLFSAAAQKILDDKYPANGSLLVPGTLEHDLVKGVTVDTLDWTNVDKIKDWNQKAQELWGFPTVKKK
jgi:ABC-type Fe3+ transport system substrate-binding protein